MVIKVNVLFPYYDRIMEQFILHVKTDYIVLERKSSLAHWRSTFESLSVRQVASIAGTPRLGHPWKVMEEIKALVEAKMHEKVKTTAIQLQALLLDHGYWISLQRCHDRLPDTYGSSCQLLLHVNGSRF